MADCCYGPSLRSLMRRRYNVLVAAVVLVVLVLLAESAQGSAHRSKGVNVAVRAKWTGTPLLLEASELVSKEGDHYFWRFVEDWLKIDKPAGPSDKDCVELIVKEGTALLGRTLSPLFHFSLLLRSLSPKIVLYRQLAQESLLTHLSSDSQRTASNDSSSTPVGTVASGTEIDAWSSSENPKIHEGKCCWVDVGIQVFFEESDLKEWLESTKERSHSKGDDLEVYEFDHVYPESEGGDFGAVLYGSVGTSCFRSFHALLREASKQGQVKYVLRPVLPSGCESSAESCSIVGTRGSVNLGGYGVELALKNMEYRAIDDRAIDDSEVKKDAGSEEGLGEDDLSKEERKPELTGEVLTFRDHLLSSGVDDTPNAWELKDLGYYTAQRIVLASEPLRLMQDINQNFPKLVSSLSRMKLNETIKEEIVSNQRMVPPGKNLFAINGALVTPETLDLFSLLEIVEGELSVAGKIAAMKVPPKYVKELLQLTEAPESSAFRLDFRSDHVHYLNNIEQDAMYRRWRSNLQDLLMPVYPGQMRFIRKNLYHAVYIIDPALPSGLKMVDRMMYYFQNNVPMRFGVIFLSFQIMNKIEIQGGDFLSTEESDEEEDVSELVIRLFLYLIENFDMQVGFGFLNLVNEALDGSGEADNEPIPASYAEDVFVDLLRAKGKTGPSILHELKSGKEFRDKVSESTKFVYKLGLSQMHPCMLMNGLFYGPGQVQNAAITAMNEEQSRLQEAVYYGRINARTGVLDHFLSDGQPRYNPQIVGMKKEERKFVSLSRAVAEKAEVLSRLQYLHHPGTEDDVKPITHWLCVDLSKRSSQVLLQQAIRYLMEGSKVGRIGVLHNMKNSGIAASSTYSVLVRLVLSVANSPSRRAKVVPFLQRVLALEQLEETNIQQVLDLATEMGLKRSYLEHALFDQDQQKVWHEQINEDRLFVSQVIGLKPGAAAVITNGRVFVQQKGRHFVAEDFTLLDSVEYQGRVKPVAAVIEGVDWNNMEADELTSEFLSTTIMAVSSSMTARSRSSETARFGMLNAKYSAIIRDSDDANLHVDAVIDPLSATGQKITPLLVLLQEWLQLSVRIVLNPMNSLADLPLKNFYRYVVPSKDDFTTDGVLTSGPVGVFANMPPTRTLTMNLDVPEPWLVEPVIAIHDLDNIVLENLKDERMMSAVYELEALVVTGHCYEKNGDPPRGLQLLLGTKIHPHMVDTIVMANLGYWQLKAAPGVWTLRLAPGRSSELYSFEGPGEGTDEGPLSKQVVVQDLKGKLVRFEVAKRRGKEDQVMLDPNQAADTSSSRKGKRKGKGLLKWATDILGSSNKHGEQGNEQDPVRGNKNLVRRRGETINIFSIASGHLYERFLKIMMLSVLKNTNRPVKFWFIKNYLSPQFKDVIPHMATEYGFEYSLITYKWPSWLHKQSEKQRIIWAYKILFLDVIFPLSLKKVIFVDADQIVRTDMGELYDMDIKGRPLAYTPFCENNKEMDGFRFWNQGFWKDHLHGKPYHISALYVVDLVKFRQSAAGDHLRVFYETLSKDPNSLSNLDQDLPNYAQHSVQIFSLPQEWLWCESWCGNSTKSQAKTIDLCNNPMTKEPKLQGARRIVKEWPALDEEARQFTENILGSGSVVSGTDVPKTTPPELNEEIAETKPDGQRSLEDVVDDRDSVDRESAAEL